MHRAFVGGLIIIPFGQLLSVFCHGGSAGFFDIGKVGRWYGDEAGHRHEAASCCFCGGRRAVEGPGPDIAFDSCRADILEYFYISCMTSYFTFFLMDKFGMSVQHSQVCLFAFLAALAVGTLFGGVLGDRFGRKYVIWGSILGLRPSPCCCPMRT